MSYGQRLGESADLISMATGSEGLRGQSGEQNRQEWKWKDPMWTIVVLLTEENGLDQNFGNKKGEHRMNSSAIGNTTGLVDADWRRRHET